MEGQDLKKACCVDCKAMFELLETVARLANPACANHWMHSSCQRRRGQQGQDGLYVCPCGANALETLLATVAPVFLPCGPSSEESSRVPQLTPSSTKVKGRLLYDDPQAPTRKWIKLERAKEEPSGLTPNTTVKVEGNELVTTLSTSSSEVNKVKVDEYEGDDATSSLLSTSSEVKVKAEKIEEEDAHQEEVNVKVKKSEEPPATPLPSTSTSNNANRAGATAPEYAAPTTSSSSRKSRWFTCNRCDYKFNPGTDHNYSRRRSNSTERNEMNTPTLNCETDWIFSHDVSRKNRDKKPGKNIGKWLIFLPETWVDEIWDEIDAATKAGDLGCSAKVSTSVGAEPPQVYRGREDDNNYVIGVYTYDWTDKKDVMKVRNTLRQMGFDWPLPYKTEADSCAGIYATRGTRISKYYL